MKWRGQFGIKIISGVLASLDFSCHVPGTGRVDFLNSGRWSCIILLFNFTQGISSVLPIAE